MSKGRKRYCHLKQKDRTRIGTRLERAVEWADRPLAKRRSIIESLRNKSHNGKCDIHSKAPDGTLHDAECKNLRKYDTPTRLKWFENNIFNKNFRQGATRTLFFSNLFAQRKVCHILNNFFSTIYVIDRQVANRAEARVLSRLLRPLRRREHAEGQLEGVTIQLSQRIEALHDDVATSHTRTPLLRFLHVQSKGLSLTCDSNDSWEKIDWTMN